VFARSTIVGSFTGGNAGAARVPPSAVKPPSRFATLEISKDAIVEDFREKHSDDVGWINGGFFVLEPKVLDLITGDDTVWEREPMQALAHRGELMGFKHPGFWKPMDTLRDKRELENLWRAGSAPWA
jgi:glucose-1-phosphate cytidylyltransferase